MVTISILNVRELGVVTTVKPGSRLLIYLQTPIKTPLVLGNVSVVVGGIYPRICQIGGTLNATKLIAEIPEK